MLGDAVLVHHPPSRSVERRPKIDPGERDQPTLIGLNEESVVVTLPFTTWHTDVPARQGLVLNNGPQGLM